MLYMTDMWEFQIRERMFFGKFFFCVCFLVSWKDVTLWFSTHTHMLLQDENHVLRQKRQIPCFKMDKLLCKNPRGYLLLGMSNSVMMIAYFGGYAFVREFVFHWGSCIPRTWASVMGGGKLLRCQQKPRKNAQLRDGVGSLSGQCGLLANLPLFAFLSKHSRMVIL